MDKQKKDLLVFGYGLGAIAAVFCVGGVLKHGFGLPQQVQAVCALVFVTVTALKFEALKPGYTGWMKVAHLIGGAITAVILSAVYFAVFMPVACVLRLLRKDHLERKIDKVAATYWHQRPAHERSVERYKQQF